MARVYVLLLILLASVNAFAGTYQVDNGVPVNSLGLTGGGTMAWLNGFQVTAGNETITAIEIMFGSFTDGASGLVNGDPVTVALWTGPSSSPASATVQRSVVTSVANADLFLFNIVPIAPITLSAGDWFFVGGIYDEGNGPKYPATMDNSGNGGASSWVAGWSVGNTVDPNNLTGSNVYGSLDTFYFPYNLMIRADAGSDVPEPGAYLLLSSGLIGLLALRRKR